MLEQARINVVYQIWEDGLQLNMTAWKVPLTVGCLATFLLIGVFPVQAQKLPERWGLDQAHSKAIFVVIHDGIAPVTGWFNKVRGTVSYDGKNLQTAKVTAHIDANSLDSGSKMRDFHLRSEHFFDVKQYPDISFVSTTIKPISPGKFQMIGDLTIRNVKKKVTLDCSGPRGPLFDKDHKQYRIGVSAKTKLNKKDFGMVWNREVSKGFFLVADEAEISLEIECAGVAN